MSFDDILDMKPNVIIIAHKLHGPPRWNIEGISYFHR